MLGICFALMVYTDTLISTIVDCVLLGCFFRVYTDTLISTIVDCAPYRADKVGLYRHFNFYYCR